MAWTVAGLVLFVVALAFIRPWYNVWSREMEGKAEFAKAEQNRKIRIAQAKANLEAEKLNARAEAMSARKAPPRQSASRTAASRPHTFSICGCAGSRTSATRLSSTFRRKRTCPCPSSTRLTNPDTKSARARAAAPAE